MQDEGQVHRAGEARAESQAPGPADGQAPLRGQVGGKHPAVRLGKWRRRRWQRRGPCKHPLERFRDRHQRHDASSAR